MELVENSDLYHVLALLIMRVYGSLDGKLGSLLVWNELHQTYLKSAKSKVVK
jgi:hypothetical protein